MDSNSASDSSQNQTTDQQDNRIASAQDSVNLVASRSTVGGNISIVSTDHDTVDKSFDFAKNVSKGAADTAAASMSNVKAATQSAIDAVKTAYQDSTAQVSQAYKDENEKLANAYTEAKAGEQKVMVAVGVAAVALVAVTALKKG